MRHSKIKSHQMKIESFLCFSSNLHTIHITEHSDDGCNSFQLKQDIKVANVSGMNKLIDIFEQFKNLVWQNAVSIRNNPNCVKAFFT